MQFPPERQLTFAPHGHILTNVGVWSPDDEWIVYDVRSDRDGSVFDGARIERVHVPTGEVQLLYESRDGASCGVATYSPVDEQIVFIHGPERPTPNWQYAPHHRRGVLLDCHRPGVVTNLDARDLDFPYTPGALRGGTHLHTFSGDGSSIAFTYEDHVSATLPSGFDGDANQRNVGVSMNLGRPVVVPKTHERNHDGKWFSVLVTRTVNEPRPGSDDISRACEEAWIGTSGYLTADGRRQRAIAFQGTVVSERGQSIPEVFVVDLPADVTSEGEIGPLAGTKSRRPQPPKGTAQRRLTRTEPRKFPGLAGPRHWLRSSPDGSRIAMLMKDDGGVVQLWTISPFGGEPTQITHNAWDILSTFTWSPDGRAITHAMDNSLFVTDMQTGASRRLTPRTSDDQSLLPLAAVFSPNGHYIAYLRRIGNWNQIFVGESAPC